MISQSCNACATTTCIKTSTGSSSQTSGSSDSGGSDAGPIAGGVIGGIAFIAIVTFLIWWFFVRKKRQQYTPEEVNQGQEKRSTFAEARQARKSTQSIASTVLTRASNVIQIAYIPGVTNRSPPETPGTLVPPVPPLPGASPDQHFFMPGDLRDSSWSDMSERRSVAPSLRSSVATTIYRSNAIVSPMPAQQVMRTRAAVVSIHNGANTPSSQSPRLAAAETPAVPAITKAQLAKANATEIGNSSIVARTVTAKPVTVRGSVRKKNNPLTSGATAPGVHTIEEHSESGPSTTVSRAASRQFDHNASTFDNSSSDEEDETEHSLPSKGSASNTATTPAATISKSSTTTDSSNASQSPFKDQPSTDVDSGSSSALNRQSLDGHGSSHRHRRSMSNNRLLAEIPVRGESPFSDANEVK
jgi:hypothetical protein